MRNSYPYPEEFGPFASAKLRLEVGLLQSRGGYSEAARENLERAAGGLETLGQETLEAVSRVALQQSGVSQPRLNTVVAQLLHPSGLDELTSRAHWLVPAIAETNVSSELMDQLLVRVPQVLAYAMKQSLVSLSGRQKILEALTRVTERPPSLVSVLAEDSDPTIRSAAAKLGTSSPSTIRDLIRIHTFGGFEAYVGEELIPTKSWRTQKTMFLVAFIAKHAPRGVLEDQVLDLFWPQSVVKGKKNLNWALSMARGCMRGDVNFNPIVRESGRLLFNPTQPIWHDLLEFQQALQDSREATGRKLALSLAQLQRLYKGPYLEGCYLDWAVRLRDELERRAGEAFLHMAQEFYTASLFDEAAEAARASVKSNPLSQEGYLLLMQSETSRGRPVEALEQFRICKENLWDEYGIEPGMDLVRAELEARMKQG